MSTLPPLDGAAPLTHCGVIHAHGADAASFLHSQLTTDFAQLGTQHAQLAGYCSAKGRLLATFIGWKSSADDVLLICSADLLAPTLKRLSMFVLRAKCKLSDATAQWQMRGLAGPSAAAMLGTEVQRPVWARWVHEGAEVVRLPDAEGTPRFLWLGAAGSTPPALPALSAGVWRRGEVASGVAMIEAATIDQFVPQMLNYELIGGVDFKKGCYPGQEIVARSQYRGTIKRRTMLFQVAAEACAGQEVFHSADPAQPAGLVANAASADGTSLALVEVKLAALDQGSLHLGDVNGPVLAPRVMPYPVPVESR